MDTVTAIGRRVLNFIVAGQVRCGASVLQTSIDMHPKATCYGELLHPSVKVRERLHKLYFGPTRSGTVPEWCEPGGWVSPEQYLTTRVFDHPASYEDAVGIKLLYPHIQNSDLWEYCHDCCNQGDFCVIHLYRNPLACYISLKQAKQTGVWAEDINARTQVSRPAPIDPNIDELTTFCRWHMAHAAKLRQQCDDRLEISYHELIVNYRKVMTYVFEYLDLPRLDDVHPGVRRLKNRSIRDRLFDFTKTRSEVPADVRVHFDAEDLF